MIGLACGRVAAARERLGLSREDFAQALATLLKWTPSADTIEQWESCAAPPPGDVIAASDILISRAESYAIESNGPDYVSVLLGKHRWTRDDLHELSAAFDAALVRSSVDEISRLAHVWLVSDVPQDIELGSGRRISDQLL